MDFSHGQDLSEASADENDRNSKCVNGAGVSGMYKRSYECVFCKRGFTNAQALGGHMNIHRKDRARAKQVMAGPSGSSMQGSYSGTVEPPKHYPIWDSSYESAWVVDRQLGESMIGSYVDCHEVPRPGYLGGTKYGVSYANLSVRIDLSPVDDFKVRNTMEEDNNEIDLELRLGQFGH